MESKLKQPARTIDMAPDLVQHTLLNPIKFADVEYISIYDGDEVNIYDGQTAKISVCESISPSILLDPLYFLGFGK